MCTIKQNAELCLQTKTTANYTQWHTLRAQWPSMTWSEVRKQLQWVPTEHKQFAGFSLCVCSEVKTWTGATAASPQFVRVMECHLMMQGCLSPWRCGAWVTVKVLYSNKGLAVESMIKAQSASLHSSVQARTKTSRIQINHMRFISQLLISAEQFHTCQSMTRFEINSALPPKAAVCIPQDSYMRGYMS